MQGNQINIIPVQTQRVGIGDDLPAIIKKLLQSKLKEGDLLVVTSKVVALWERRVVVKDANNEKQKHQLVADEADYYLPASISRYKLLLTRREHILGVNAGIDESNVDSAHYVLLPKDAYDSAQKIWEFCRKEFGLKNLGVVISDSRSAPLKLGVFGTGLAHCGFVAMQDKRGDEDLYGRKLKMTQINLVESVAQVAVFAMGEGGEGQPLAIVRGVRNVKFSQEPPDHDEKASVKIDIEDDIYGPILTSVVWKSKTNKN